MFEFRFPDVGEGIIEGTIVKWHVKEGDTVKNDQILAEIETDKAVVEIPSPRAGVILKLHGKENEIVKVGAALVTFGEPGEKYMQEDAERAHPASGASAQRSEESGFAGSKRSELYNLNPQKGIGVIGTLEVSDAIMKSPEKSIQKSKTPKNAPPEKPLDALPRTRVLAQQLNVDLGTLKGTGPGGRITDEDVKKAAQLKMEQTQKSSSQENAPQTLKLFGPFERLPFKGVRKVIAHRMSQSLYTAPHVTIMDNADVTDLAKKRNQEKIEAEKQNIKLTFLPYIMEACVVALQQFPIVNSSLDEITQEIVLKKYYNLGFAVDADEGLIVPVIKDVDKKSIFDLARELADLAEKTRERKITTAEMEGHTFSLTNYGSFGGLYATPIINYPDAAILGIGRMKEMPAVVQAQSNTQQSNAPAQKNQSRRPQKIEPEEPKIEIRKILPLSLAFDHRLFDGALAAKFLNTIIQNLEKN